MIFLMTALCSSWVRVLTDQQQVEVKVKSRKTINIFPSRWKLDLRGNRMGSYHFRRDLGLKFLNKLTRKDNWRRETMSLRQCTSVKDPFN